MALIFQIPHEPGCFHASYAVLGSSSKPTFSTLLGFHQFALPTAGVGGPSVYVLLVLLNE